MNDPIEVRLKPERFHRVTLVSPSVAGLFRFGGRPPKGVRPLHHSKFTGFLLTLPFTNDLCCSLFANLTGFDPDSPYFVFSAAGVLNGENSELIEARWHPPELQLDDVVLPVVFPAFDFRTGEEGHDPIPLDDGLPHPEDCDRHHKIGGYPHFYQPDDEVVESSRQLVKDGFHHHFQLGFPSAEDAEVNCNWPFGEYVFHVFAKPIGSQWELRSVWS